jgi:biopolymer transport protein ExbD
MLNISAARKNRRQPLDINMAPLIDMVFILLIFFLVTTSFVKESGVDVNRPTAATAESMQKAGIMIGVDKDNRIFMEKREIDMRAVRANVERAIAENPESTVVIVADRLSRTGIAIEVMDACRLAGAESVSIAARLPSEGQ